MTEPTEPTEPTETMSAEAKRAEDAALEALEAMLRRERLLVRARRDYEVALLVLAREERADQPTGRARFVERSQALYDAAAEQIEAEGLTRWRV